MGILGHIMHYQSDGFPNLCIFPDRKKYFTKLGIRYVKRPFIPADSVFNVFGRFEPMIPNNSDRLLTKPHAPDAALCVNPAVSA